MVLTFMYVRSQESIIEKRVSNSHMPQQNSIYAYVSALPYIIIVLTMPYQHLCLTRRLELTLMDTLSRNQHSSIEASQMGWLFGDSLKNGNCDCSMATCGDLEVDLSDGMVVENCNYTITNCVKDCE